MLLPKLSKFNCFCKMLTLTFNCKVYIHDVSLMYKIMFNIFKFKLCIMRYSYIASLFSPFPVFKDLINTEVNNNSRVVVIATSKSRDSLHPSLLTSRGCHVFQCCAELHPPDADQRKQNLLAMMTKRFPLQDPEVLEPR